MFKKIYCLAPVLSFGMVQATDVVQEAGDGMVEIAREAMVQAPTPTAESFLSEHVSDSASTFISQKISPSVKGWFDSAVTFFKDFLKSEYMKPIVALFAPLLTLAQAHPYIALGTLAFTLFGSLFSFFYWGRDMAASSSLAWSLLKSGVGTIGVAVGKIAYDLARKAGFGVGSSTAIGFVSGITAQVLAMLGLSYIVKKSKEDSERTYSILGKKFTFKFGKSGAEKSTLSNKQIVGFGVWTVFVLVIGAFGYSKYKSA